MTPKPRKREPELFLNRELSWLQFNQRVLEEALDPQTPLLERLKFCAITASNLDEFFMVRVAALVNAIAAGDVAPDPSGLTPSQQLDAISARAHTMVRRLYQTLLGDILPGLAGRGIRILEPAALEPLAAQSLARQCRDDVFPALTPLAIDSSRPFPLLAGLSLNLAVLVGPEKKGGEARLAVVQVPNRLPRLLRPVAGDGTSYVLLEDAIRGRVGDLFPGQKILDSAVFRITRDSELDLDDEGGRDFLEMLQEELANRRRSGIVRLEVSAAASDALLAMLTQRVGVGAGDVYRIPGPLDVRAFFPLVDLPQLEDLRDPPLRPLLPPDAPSAETLFESLDQKDVILNHPFESFDPVIAFVERAAEDPDVLAIKQTLYRTSGDSPIVRALARAAENGKQVTVLFELTARFDEQSNIRWARRLEESGAHVIYGIRGYKTHAKICMVVRRGPAGIRRYVHLGTGNYNDKTARLYTDFSLITSDPLVGEDASVFFNALTGYSDPPRMRRLVMAPTHLRERLLRLIERERRRAEEGQAGQIRGRMNSLVDEDIIRALYECSRAGVTISLNVRGVCCLRPGLKGKSENIEVTSIVDRFLEHPRVFHFRNGGDDEVYLSSADWMPRNLDRRIELLFPVESAEAKARVLASLDLVFRDNVKARRLLSDGTYRRLKPTKGEEAVRSQIALYREAQKAVERSRGSGGVTFEPIRDSQG